MKKVILDTNVVVDMVEFKVDIFREMERILDFPYQVCVVQGTIAELEQIIKTQRLRFQRAARLGLALLKAKNVKILPGKGKVDDVLAEYSQRGALILTQDWGLKTRLQKPFLTIRQRRKVVMVS